MFRINSDKWAGAIKLLEECNELGVALAKLMEVDGDVQYFDGRSTVEAIEDEIADVMAAIVFFEANNKMLDYEYINQRAQEKADLYTEWKLG